VTVTDCPTCGQPLAGPPCEALHPDRLLLGVRCELPAGHRSEEHWHRPLQPGAEPVEWYDA
jgi:hypothetical protein